MPVVYSRKRLRAPPPLPPSPSSLPATPSATPPPSPRAPRKRRRLVQLHLDAGQPDISATSCAECGMVYAAGAAGDAAVHRAHHAAVLRRRRPTLRRARAERVVARAPRGRYVAVRPADKHAPRMRAVDAWVRDRLGGGGRARFAQGWRGAHAWVAVAYVVGADVQGYLYAERVEEALEATVGTDGVALAGGTSVQRPLCGVRRVWVDEAARRRGIARKMVHLARAHLVYGHVFAEADVAFTAPTRDGAFLAARFGGDSVLVYAE